MAAPERHSEHSLILPRDGDRPPLGGLACGGGGGCARAARVAGAGPCAAASSCEAGWWVAMWLRRRGLGVPSASEGGTSSAAGTEMGSWVRTICGKLKQRLRLDVGREICRQYPLFCFLLLCLSAASLLLNRYLRVAAGRPLGSPQTAGRRPGAHSAQWSREGRWMLRPDVRADAGREPRSLRGYLAPNLSFLTISQRRAFIVCFTTTICNATSVRVQGPVAAFRLGEAWRNSTHSPRHTPLQPQRFLAVSSV